VLLGTIDEIVEQTLVAVKDPRASSARVNARPWVLGKHTPERWVPVLEQVYREASAGRAVTPGVPNGQTPPAEPRHTAQ
jgi:hypothetical protein